MKCNFGAEMDVTVPMEEIRKSVMGNLDKLSQRVELSQMGHHDNETVSELAARLRGMTHWRGLEIVCC